MLNTKPPILGFSGSYRWLSNFAPCNIEYDGVRYNSVENAYVAAKTLDIASRVFLETCTPGQAKRYGKSLTLRSDWDNVKVSVMRNLLTQKFSQSPYNSLLVETEGQYIEEANSWGDRFWGVCEGTGKNVLGILLMDIRDELTE